MSLSYRIFASVLAWVVCGGVLYLAARITRILDENREREDSVRRQQRGSGAR